MRLSLMVALAGLAVAGCVTTTTSPTDAFTPILTRADFIAQVADRPIVDDSNFVINSNGTVTGLDDKGEPISGNWTWENGAWCRYFNLADGPTKTKCREIAITATQIRFTTEENEEQFYNWGA